MNDYDFLVALLGLARPEQVPGTHRHRCPSCKVVWEHANSQAGNNAAHHCPRCGEEEFYKYFGPIEPTYIEEPFDGPYAA